MDAAHVIYIYTHVYTFVVRTRDAVKTDLSSVPKTITTRVMCIWKTRSISMSLYVHRNRTDCYLCYFLRRGAQDCTLQMALPYASVTGELCKLAELRALSSPPLSPLGRCLPATGRCRAVRYKRQCPFLVSGGRG